MARFIDLALSAIMLAGLYATMAYGLGLIYGVLRVVNLAHGGVIMGGAYLGWVLFERWGLDPYLSLPIVIVASFGLGVLMYRLLVRQDRWSHGGGSWALPLYSGATMQACDFIGDDKLDRSWWERAGHDQRAFPAVAYPDGEGFVLLCLADAGGARSIRLHGNGRFKEPGPAVAFKTASPGAVLTSLAMRDERTLLAAIDGQVVELQRAGGDWQETRRWNSWGTSTAERFGASIVVACDGGRLLIADTERQRVMWFAGAGGKPLAQFGRSDAPGSDLQSLSAPGLIALCGERAVVFDSGNQRLVKLALSAR